MSQAHPIPRTLVLHDADCGFCTRCAEALTRLPLAIDVSSLQAEDLTALGIDPVRARAEMPVVQPDGSIAWGHRAWAAILGAGPLPMRWAGRALASRLMDRPAAFVYRLVAQNRHRLPGGTVACAMPVQSPPRSAGDV